MHDSAPATPMPTAAAEPTPAAGGGTGLLWCLHVLGFDEYVPAPSREEADAACVLLNAAFARLENHEARARLKAQTEPWPFGALQHELQLHCFADLMATELCR